MQRPSLGIRCIFYNFDLYKTQKTHENTREDSIHNIGVILSVVYDFPEQDFEMIS